jgi:hypothetical protein
LRLQDVCLPGYVWVDATFDSTFVVACAVSGPLCCWVASSALVLPGFNKDLNVDDDDADD